MKFSTQTPPNTNLFKQAIIKSLNENKQLIFSKKLTITQINQKNNKNISEQNEKEEEENIIFPLVEISDIKDIIDIPNTDNKLTGIVCFFDNRTIFIDGIKKYFDKEKKEFIPLTSSIYFPLTREKLIMNCKSKFIIDEEKINYYWSSLTEEEKLQYETVDKDSIKPDDDKESRDDLVKYIAQEQKKPSPNFSVLLLIPIKVWYTIFPMPQVIAHINKKKFESLLKPHKMPRKFLMNYDSSKNDWTSVQLN
jgi:hypothetical protein